MSSGDGRYRSFGLSLQSELPLPEAGPDPAAAVSPDVRIRYGDARRPCKAVEVANDVLAGPTVFWMQIGGIGRLLVREGCDIEVALEDGVGAERIRPFLLGSALGALLHQRGLLVLHAGSVGIGGGAAIFLGTSGAGKSTLTWAMTAGGASLLSDDLTVVDFVAGIAVVRPGLHDIRLWGASLRSRGRIETGLVRVMEEDDKYHFPLTACAPDLALPVRAVFTLGATEEGVRIPPVEEAQLFRALVANTFRGQLVRPMEASERHFRQCLEIARQAKGFELLRPWRFDQLDETVAAVWQTCGGP